MYASHLELNAFKAPERVFCWVSAIVLAAPSALLRASVNPSVSLVPSESTKNAGAANLPTKSTAVPNLSELLVTLLKASFIVNPFALSSMNVFFNAVPALEPFIPELAKVPNKAVVSSTLAPTALAAGAAVFIDSLNFSKSKADPLNDLAITSVTRPVSEASKPKPPRVAPAIAAASLSSDPVAAAKFNVASVASSICCSLKPNLANSVCSSDTWLAANIVDSPNLFASSVKAFILSGVVPNTEANLATPSSKSLTVLIELFISLIAEAAPTKIPNWPATLFKVAP